MKKEFLPDIPKSAHFIGIGGAGMSAIALVLKEQGCFVSGSDLKLSHYVRKMQTKDIAVEIGHRASTIDAYKPEVVVVSSAIPDTNPELIRAQELGCKIWPRAKMLSALSKHKTTIAIAGTHGKTTTSSMCATMLEKMGNDPSFLIGGIVEGYDTNGRSGTSEYFVAEADESDGSFLFLAPDVVVVTNIEPDHLDHYKTLENLENTFLQFMQSTSDEGVVVVCAHDRRLVELAHLSQKRVVTYGFVEDATYRIHQQPANSSKHASIFVVTTPQGNQFEISLKLSPGVHNILNATASFACAGELGLNLDLAARALSEFKGVKRRFTHIGEVNGIRVVDDYAHHPTEVKATIHAAKQLGYERVVVLFQPHRYSRTEAFAKEFSESFGECDVLVVMDVFAASEMPIPGVSGKLIADGVLANGSVSEVVFAPLKRDLIETLVEVTKPGDLLITMGAGDVTDIGPRFVQAVQQV